MGRMHSKGKGMSSSALPYKRSPPSWSKATAAEVRGLVAARAPCGRLWCWPGRRAAQWGAGTGGGGRCAAIAAAARRPPAGPRALGALARPAPAPGGG
jgi:hypothetical protein